MRILQIREQPIKYYPFSHVATGGRDEYGKRRVIEVQLPVYFGTVDYLPVNLDALIISSDLQGNIKKNDKDVLLGEELPDFLKLLIEKEYPAISCNNIGAILCGDLYATLNKRGGLGDVRNVWREFNNKFKWVCGVAGNHDCFGSKIEFNRFKKEPDINFIEYGDIKIDELEIGGLSGIIGPVRKLFRVDEREYLSNLKKLLLKRLDFIVLHESPSSSEYEFQGNQKIEKEILQSYPTLIFSGHSHWEKPIVELKNGTKIVNVDKKVLILTRDK